MNITSGKSEAPDFERQFLGELVEEMLAFRAAFEQLLAVLSSFKREEAKALVRPSTCRHGTTAAATDHLRGSPVEGVEGATPVSQEHDGKQ